MTVQRLSLALPLALAVTLTVGGLASPAAAQTFWVATDGDDGSGDGSSGAPWATIEHALSQVPDGSLILVRPGTYNGRVRLDESFAAGVTVRSELPYRARLRHSATVVTCYTGQGIALEGFDVAHSGPGAGALVIQIQDLLAGADRVERITIRDNVIHDSWNNDLLKINNGAGDVEVVGNLFYNQAGSDEHIDINSVTGVVVRDNVFFNDFAGSGRPVGNDTSSFIVIKDSNGSDDGVLGAEGITVRRNVFLHWEGSTGSNFVLLGEDGQPYYEARDVLVENNLMLGDGPNTMRAPFGVKGSRDVVFRHNTIVGDLPSLAYAMRFNLEGANLVIDNVACRHNVWSDPTGTMGAVAGGGANDFSDTPPGETQNWVLERNLYFNGGQPIPEDAGELINYTDDASRLVADPGLPAAVGITLPRWLPGGNVFADGSASIRGVFERLVAVYGTFPSSSPLRDAALPGHSPADDVLGRPRDGSPDLGAWEWRPTEVVFADGFESADTAAWSATVP
jgi:hypothetical protein